MTGLLARCCSEDVTLTLGVFVSQASKASLESKPINLGLRISSSVLDIAPADYEKCVEPCETEPDSDQETEVTPPTKSPTDLTAGLVSVSDASVLFIPSLAVSFSELVTLGSHSSVYACSSGFEVEYSPSEERSVVRRKTNIQSPVSSCFIVQLRCVSIGRHSSICVALLFHLYSIHEWSTQ